MNNNPLMKLRLRSLSEPKLLFGGNKEHFDPKIALANYGPVDMRPSEIKHIQLGLVGPESEVRDAQRWFTKLDKPLIDSVNNALRFPNFPGTGKAFACNFEIPQKFVRTLPEKELQIALAQTGGEQFESLLALYANTIGGLFVDAGPAAIIVCFPEEIAELRIQNPRLSFEERKFLQKRQEEADSLQLDLFSGANATEKNAASEMIPQADALLFRNFHRALKARCMLERNAVPLQIVRRHTYVPAEASQSEAARAWHLCTALYYKSSNIPWQPADLAPGSCFVGISFHHLKRRDGDILYASLAQAFSTDTEPFALKGEMLPDRQVRDKQPYLLPEQAKNIVRKVIEQFKIRTGTNPSRIVIHKSSLFQPEEIEGFISGCSVDVPSCEMIWIKPTGFRLIRKGTKEVERGMFANVENEKHYLFTTGYVDWWKEYPGPHVPAPLEIGSPQKTDLIERAKEILALTKMNWNSADGMGRHPITLSFARQVGAIMTELDDSREIHPLYRYYM
jgi:hypothetical protein